MNPTPSRIFIRNVTVLDCAILTPRGPVGRSWYVDVLWEGVPDDIGMVFDFGPAKKVAKAVIDTCFDHRLWVPERYVLDAQNTRCLVSNLPQMPLQPTAQAPLFALSTWEDALWVVPNSAWEPFVRGEEPHALEHLMEAAIQESSPQGVNRVRVQLRDASETLGPTGFTYTHSLRCHCGNCQRFHGHSSVLEVWRKGIPDRTSAMNMAHRLRNTYLVKHDYIVQRSSSAVIRHMVDHIERTSSLLPHNLVMGYSGSQGELGLIHDAASVLLLPCESTIENLSQWIHGELGLGPEDTVLACEGLAKGSIAGALCGWDESSEDLL